MTGQKPTKRVPGLSRAVAVGPRIFLRRPTPKDETEFISLRDVNQRFLLRWEPRAPFGKHHIGPMAFKRVLSQNRTPRYRKYLVCLGETGEIIGMVNFNGLSPHPFLSTTMGYWISRRFARQGLMTEAIGLGVEHAFTKLGLHRVEANIMPVNKASLALIRRCGFRFEGLAKRYLQINGRWSDHERWAMTIEDWQQRRTRQVRN